MGESSGERLLVSALTIARTSTLTRTRARPEYGVAALPKDMALLVEIGLNPMLVIQGATSIAAECIGVNADLGTIEAGKLADIIVVDGDPLSNMEAIKNITCVIKGGVIEKNKLNKSQY